ncbi:MAG TPA: hypothetical protein VK699_05925 [Terriglobales bacterium]|jgi:hypothetical protein|nr:hypothetical protein [Terriglobales bacterium]
MIYSHVWDRLLKLVSAILFGIAAVILNLAERIQSAGIATQSDAVFVMIVILTVIWLILYRQFLSILSSWLYATISLRTNISFKEAKALRKLFQVDFSMTWVPLRQIKKLPSNQRHAALMMALNRIGPGRKARFL